MDQTAIGATVFAVKWVSACRISDFVDRQVLRFDSERQTYAIFCSAEGEYFATSGYCTHEQAHLSEGLVVDYEIECPRHSGVFDYRTGEAIGAPACVDLRTFPVRVEDGLIFIAVNS